MPFRIAPGVTLPVGGYDFATARVGYTLGQQRRVSGSLLVESGGFYSGTRIGGDLLARPRQRDAAVLDRAERVAELGGLAEGAFTSRLASARVTYTVSPRMFVSALVQDNSDGDSQGRQRPPALGVPPGQRAVRRLQRTARHARREFPDMTNRAFVVKINRLLRF